MVKITLRNNGYEKIKNLVKDILVEFEFYYIPMNRNFTIFVIFEKINIKNDHNDALVDMKNMKTSRKRY